MTVKDILNLKKIEKGRYYGIYLFPTSRNDYHIFMLERDCQITFNNKVIYHKYFTERQLND